MKLVAIADLSASDAVTFAYTSGPEATFTFPPPDEKTPARVVKVRTDGTSLRFFPERAAGHRDVLATLGLAE